MLVRQRIYPLMSPLSEASDCLPRRLRCRRSFTVAKISDANYEQLIGNAGRIMLIATARASGAHKRGYASRADALLSTEEATGRRPAGERGPLRVDAAGQQSSVRGREINPR